jgi:hypothetical protein
VSNQLVLEALVKITLFASSAQPINRRSRERAANTLPQSPLNAIEA